MITHDSVKAAARAITASGHFTRTAFGAVLLLATTFLSAQPSGGGSIQGTVVNAATQKVLERAVVILDGTNQSTTTSSDGTFRLWSVPPGMRSITVSYAGLSDGTATVQVSAGSTASVEIALRSDVIEMGEFRVSAEPEGNAYAVQQQKNAESMRNVVSADAFGVISDANPGEFLKLMPGIQMDYTGIEPRGVRVRGMEPNLNLVLINGNQAAAAAGSSTNRNFEFDQTTIDNIESIEVFKAPIPSMPANAIGGTVNMVTRSAFLQKGRRISASANVTMNSDALSTGRSAGPFDRPSRKIKPGGSFMFSDSFLDGRLGVVLSLSQVNMNGFGPNASRSFAYSGAPAAPQAYTRDNTAARVSNYNRNEHSNFTSRSGGSLNLDYKVSDSTTAYLRTTYTDHYYFFANRQWVLATGNSVAPGATAQRVEALPASGQAQQNVTVGDKLSESLTINPGVRHRFDAWTVEYDLSVSRATNKYDYLPDNGSITGAPNFANVTVTVPNVGFVIASTDDIAVATITQTAGADIYDLANYRPTGFSVSTSDRQSTDRVLGAKGRVRRDFVARFPFYVEAGGSVQEQERSRKQPNRRWNYVGPDGIAGTADDTTAANMQQFAERGHTPDIGFGQPAPNAWVSPFRLAEFYGMVPRAFVLDEAHAYESAFTNNRTIREKITAGYLMTNVKLGKMDVLLGTRIERTEVEGEGARKDDSKVPAGVPVNSLAGMIAKYSRTTAETSYTPSPFKYAHLTYRFDDRLQARASYTESIGRANFGSILPGSTINDSAQTITFNNTELLPQRSGNYDVSLEWYPIGTASLTASWFSKSIKDYINNARITITQPLPGLDIGSEYVGWDLITSSNLGSAEIEGYEFGGRYQFRFLPEVLRNLEVFGNYTRLYKTEGTFTAGEATTKYDQLPSAAPRFWNFGFNYTTPNRKLYLVIRGNYIGAIPTNITGRPYAQTDSRLTYDGEIRYSLTPRYTLSLAGRNLTEEWEGGSQIGRVVRTGNGGGAAYTLTLNARY